MYAHVTACDPRRRHEIQTGCHNEPTIFKFGMEYGRDGKFQCSQVAECSEFLVDCDVQPTASYPVVT